MASLSDAKNKGKTTEMTAQQQTQALCTGKGGIPILNQWDDMTDCKFKAAAAAATFPPCDLSDLPDGIPSETRAQIRKQRQGYCI